MLWKIIASRCSNIITWARKQDAYHLIITCNRCCHSGSHTICTSSRRSQSFVHVHCSCHNLYILFSELKRKKVCYNLSENQKFLCTFNPWTCVLMYLLKGKTWKGKLDESADLWTQIAASVVWSPALSPPALVAGWPDTPSPSPAAAPSAWSQTQQEDAFFIQSIKWLIKHKANKKTW